MIENTTYEQYRENFLRVIAERYHKTMTSEEYDAICAPEYIKNNLQIIWKKSHNRYVAYIKIDDVEYPVMWNKTLNCPITVYTDLDGDMSTLTRALFGNLVYKFALNIYKAIIEEYDQHPKNFESMAEAAKYFHKNSNFPSYYIHKYKTGQWDIMKIFMGIREILHGSKAYKITVTKTKKHEHSGAGQGQENDN